VAFLGTTLHFDIHDPNQFSGKKSHVGEHIPYSKPRTAVAGARHFNLNTVTVGERLAMKQQFNSTIFSTTAVCKQQS